jgi:hypothetical protein
MALAFTTLHKRPLPLLHYSQIGDVPNVSFQNQCIHLCYFHIHPWCPEPTNATYITDMRLQASTTVYLRPSAFCNIAHCRLVVGYSYFWTAYHFKNNEELETGICEGLWKQKPKPIKTKTSSSQMSVWSFFNSHQHLLTCCPLFTLSRNTSINRQWISMEGCMFHP